MVAGIVSGMVVVVVVALVATRSSLAALAAVALGRAAVVALTPMASQATRLQPTLAVVVVAAVVAARTRCPRHSQVGRAVLVGPACAAFGGLNKWSCLCLINLH